MSKKNRKKARAGDAAEAARFGAGLTGEARAVWLAGLGALRTARKKGTAEFEALAARGARLRDGAEDAAGWALARVEVERLRARLHALEDRLARLSGGDRPAPAVFRVRAHADGWAVTRDGADEPIGLFARKKPALSAARAAARRSAPSRLVAHGRDGAEQETQDYPA